jgi:hypothetical protein
MRFFGSLCVCALALAGCASPPGASQAPPLQGIVYGSEGTALGSVEISASVADGDQSPTVNVRSGIDGRFSLPGSHRGALTITASRPGYESSASTVMVTDAAEILYLRLRSATDIVDEAGRALASGRVGTARQTALKAVDVAPDDPAVRFEAAAILLRSGDPPAARQALDRFPANAVSDAMTLLRDRIAEAEAAR